MVWLPETRRGREVLLAKRCSGGSGWQVMCEEADDKEITLYVMHSSRNTISREEKDDVVTGGDEGLAQVEMWRCLSDKGNSVNKQAHLHETGMMVGWHCKSYFDR